MRRLWSRRDLLKAGALGALGTAAAGRVGAARRRSEAEDHVSAHGGNVAVGEADLSIFDPSAYLTDFDYGEVSRSADGRTVRTYRLNAYDREIVVAPGVRFPAWTYNGRVPGPTLRCREGDLVRVEFINGSAHPHTVHFHGIHPANMDGVFEQVMPGDRYVYEFVAEPFGLHLYHCHTMPLRRHIHRGLYGVFIIDPPTPRPPAHELVMVMNAFDTNFDGKNEVYAVNTIAFHYLRHPIRIRRGELVRVYLVNITEFDPVNSMHIHANFFHEYRTGTSLQPDRFTDVTFLGQAERSILEFTYRHPGRFMFHAHQSEFVELGWSGLFEVVD